MIVTFTKRVKDSYKGLKAIYGRKMKEIVFQLLPLDGRYFLTVALKTLNTKVLKSSLKNLLEVISSAINV